MGSLIDMDAVHGKLAHFLRKSVKPYVLPRVFSKKVRTYQHLSGF